MSLLSRTTSDPDVCHGKPPIRGLSYPVQDLLAALEFGALATSMRRMVPLDAA